MEQELAYPLPLKRIIRNHLLIGIVIETLSVISGFLMQDYTLLLLGTIALGMCLFRAALLWLCVHRNLYVAIDGICYTQEPDSLLRMQQIRIERPNEPPLWINIRHTESIRSGCAYRFYFSGSSIPAWFVSDGLLAYEEISPERIKSPQ